MAHSRVGDVLQAQGQLKAAQAAFEEYLAISRRLAEQDPSNAGWQRELAVAHSRVGGCLEAQGRLEAAQAAFEEYLAISRRLAEQDPSNADWQRDLALACLRIGRIAATAPTRNTALAAIRGVLRYLAALVHRAPGFVQWAEDMKIVEAELTALRATIASSPDGAADRASDTVASPPGEPGHGVARGVVFAADPAGIAELVDRRKTYSRPISPVPEDNRGR